MARSFNGSSDRIGVPFASELQDTGSYTISAWFNTSRTSGIGIIAGNFVISGATSQLYVDNQHLNIEFADNSGHDVLVSSTATINDGRWHLGIGVRDRNSLLISIYIDGVSSATPKTDTTNADLSTSGGIDIGCQQNGASSHNDFFQGSLADITIWNVALTTGEIAGLASGQRPYLIRPQNLKGWLPLFGDVSPEPDLSGNANNGTLTGTALAAGPPTTLFTPRWPQPITSPLVTKSHNLPLLGVG